MMGFKAKAALTLSALLPGLTYALGFGDVRLHSTLNAPLDADIGIVATADELQGLKAAIASRDSFARNGLDYPNFLASATVTVAKAADGSNVLHVQTADPATEPFVTMLIEVNYSRGRLLREYTVLLDPPVLGNQAVNGPISAPVSTANPVAGAPVTNTTSSVVPVAASPMPPASGSNYRVQRGDSLSSIAARRIPAANRSAALVGIYRANPEAFDGNMNVLRAGSELRLPSEAELAALSPAVASAEVSRQYQSWHGAGRLRLVPPGEAAPSTSSSAASTGGGAPSDSPGLRRQVDELQKQLTETQRLLELKSEQLAQLQAGAKGSPSVAAATPTPTPAPAPAVAPAPAPVPAAVEAAPQTSTTTAVTPKPAGTPPVAAAPSLLDRMLEQWQLLLAALVIAALLAFVLLRRKRGGNQNEPRDFDRFSTTGTLSNTGSFEKSAAISQTLPARVLPVDDSESIVVSESGVRPALKIGSVNSDEATDGAVDARATLASTGTQPMLVPAGGDDSAVEFNTSDSATALERGDPLAEADFHMAYGLYDQAADLVKKAIASDPARRELKLKLLEVFFVWGNKEQFLQLAHELADNRNAGESGEWEKIQIMGRQIAADDAMFAGNANLGGATRGSVDLNLEGGQNRVDFNIMGEPTITSADADEIDLDFGNATDVLPDTAEAPKLQAHGDMGVDFILDDPERGSETGETTASASLISMPDATAETRQMLQATRVQPPGFDDLDIGDTRAERNTARMPGLGDAEVGTIRQKLGGQAALQGAALLGSEQTAELSIDDLGLDLGTVEVPATTRQQPAMPEAGGTVDLLLEASGAHGDIDESSATRSGELSVTGEATALTEAFDAAATAARPALTLPGAGDTANHQALEADPPTMSEVGTKLDLARAYMDMGDPEGARSILDEVLKEGSTSQKQEAQRLLESLPG